MIVKTANVLQWRISQLIVSKSITIYVQLSLRVYFHSTVRSLESQRPSTKFANELDLAQCLPLYESAVSDQ